MHHVITAKCGITGFEDVLFYFKWFFNLTHNNIAYFLCAVAIATDIEAILQTNAPMRVFSYIVQYKDYELQDPNLTNTTW